jgi:hypothetical protein
MEIAIIGANFEERIIRPVPLVEHFLNHVIGFPKLEADRSLIFLSAGVAFHTQFHLPSPIVVLTGRSVMVNAVQRGGGKSGARGG